MTNKRVRDDNKKSMVTVQTFTSLISQILPEPHAGLLSGILFGVKQTLDPDLKQALVATGTLHIVALSGMNITMISDMVIQTLLHMFSRKIASILSIIAIIAFILFVGPSASVIRAGIMGSMSLMGIVFGKPVFALWSWGIAVTIILVAKPLWITDLSFQLSVLASLGMILFGGGGEIGGLGDREIGRLKDDKTVRLGDREIGGWVDRVIGRLGDPPSPRLPPSLKLRRTGRWASGEMGRIKTVIAGNFRTTMAAQTFTTPLLFLTFGRLSLISPITNVLIVWTLPIITILGFIVVFAGLVWYPLGQALAWVEWLFLQYLLLAITWTAKVPGASVGG